MTLGNEESDPTGTALIRRLAIDILADRYRAVQSIGSSYGGLAFLGRDIHTEAKVFVKYLICPRGEGERAKFLMERDAIEYLQRFDGRDFAPHLLHFQEFPELQSMVIVTEWIEGESLASWLERCKQLSFDERLAVFHRVVRCMSGATLVYQHRDFHPGNVVLLPEAQVRLGVDVLPKDETAAVRILDWGEAIPVLQGNYDDEPDHHFVMLAVTPRTIAGAFTSLPPEVFKSWKRNRYFGGTYEAWGLGMLLYRIFSDIPLELPSSLGDYASHVYDGTLSRETGRRRAQLETLALPGSQIIPRLYEWMMKETPEERAPLSTVGRVLWDVRFEGLSITDLAELRRYFSSPGTYEPPGGWTYSQPWIYD